VAPNDDRSTGSPLLGGEPVLTVDRVSKTFVGQRALQDVSFDVASAEVHALVGHNGSGKSTLMKILAGYHVPDPGSGPIEVAAIRLPAGDPAASHAAGMRFIHQELGLVEGLTVLENLRLGGRWATTWGRIRWRRERDAARDALDRVGLRVHPDVLVSDLGAIQRTQVAVARALQDGEDVRLMFFDEPTATLPSSEVERLFELIAATVAQGIGVVYISHRLAELPVIANRITVLRDGHVVGTGQQREFSRERLVELIVGAPLQEQGSPPRAKAPASSAEFLRFDAVEAGEIRGMSFAVGPGEIVGMAGLVGSGVHDVPATLLGRVPLTSGSIRVEGEDVHSLAPHQLTTRKIAVLPSARALRNVPNFTVRENLTLPDLQPLWQGGRLRLRRERAVAFDLVDRFRISPRRIDGDVAQLSGGNQQKVSIAKWMRLAPKLLVLDEPTQGVDVGGRREILEILRRAASSGVAILVCSSDLEDLEDVCDRVLIVRNGRIGTELSGSELTRERVAEECYREDEVGRQNA
jgi:ribose transport system ATP-binding protein